MSEQKWEYKVTKVSKTSAKEEFDELGEDGWELVSVVYTSFGVEAFFKRPKK